MTEKAPSKSSTLFQAEKARVIYIFKNGDRHEKKGARVLIHSSKIKSFDQVLTEFSEQLGLHTGPVRKVIDTGGNPVKSLDDFVHDGKYLCCGPEKVMIENLPVGFAERYTPKNTPTKSSAEGSSSTPEKKTPVKSDVKTPTSSTTPRTPSSVEKFGVQTTKGKNIQLFKRERNSDATSLVIHPTKFKTIDQVKESMGRSFGTPVKKIYTVEGKLVDNLDEFEDGKSYVCCSSAEPWSKEYIPIKAQPQKQMP